MWVTIDPDSPRPWERTGFAISNLEQFVAHHRAELLGALLTLIRAWVLQGRPQTAMRSDSFAGFVHAAQGVLTMAGIPGEVMSEASNKAQIGADDVEWATLLAQLVLAFGTDGVFTARQVSDLVIYDWAAGRSLLPTNVALFESLPDKLAERAERGHSIARPLGLWLRHRIGRYSGGLAVREAYRRDNTVHYKIVASSDRTNCAGSIQAPPPKEGTTGTTGTSSGQQRATPGRGGTQKSPPSPDSGSGGLGLVPAVSVVPPANWVEVWAKHANGEREGEGS